MHIYIYMCVCVCVYVCTLYIITTRKHWYAMVKLHQRMIKEV